VNDDENIEYENRAVAFIDLLGFRERVSSLQDGDQEELKKIIKVLELMKNQSRFMAKQSEEVSIDLEVSFFSDSVVLSVNKQDAAELIWRTGWLQSALLVRGELPRGGISVGKVYHHGGILFGDGMLNAYNLESKAAMYPRVIVEKGVISDTINDPMAFFITVGSDGLTFVNPFMFPIDKNGGSITFDDNESQFVYLKGISQKLHSGKTRTKKPEHTAKWDWMIAQLDNYAGEKLRDDLLAEYYKT